MLYPNVDSFIQNPYPIPSYIETNEFEDSVVQSVHINRLIYYNNFDKSAVIVNVTTNLITLFFIFIFNLIYPLPKKSSPKLTSIALNLNTPISRNFQEYIDLHNFIIQKSENETKRITFCIPGSVGYGNKIYTLISSMVVAIITDTAIKIEWPEIEQFIQCPLKDIFKKYDSPNQDKRLRINPIADLDWKYEKSIENLKDIGIPLDMIEYKYINYEPLFFALCSNPSYHQKLLDYDLVKKESILNAKEVFTKGKNLSESEAINRLYQIGFEVGSNLLNKIWTFEPNFQAEIDKIYNENFKNHFVIGIQIRSEYIDTTDINKFIECAKHIEQINHASSVKWFLTSDSEKIIDTLSADYGHLIIKGKGNIGHILFSSNYYSRTVMDVELLSKANEIIITGGSTYGFVSSMKKQILPYFVEGKRNENEKPCRKMTFNKAPRRPEGYSLI
ncbi:unnamed protein product [Brachionus calyciflorus]|uniref:Uncharacterized protein n=1 Tax=Brachionus calyciflorus TaxID=104777 RepID=A0A814ESS0_9BILA|nr:unnamed protein product [Brachionus calyciflorus]